MSYLLQSLPQISQQVVYMLQSYRKPDGSRINLLFGLLRLAQLRVSGARRMDNKRFRIGHVREQGENLQAVDETVSLVLSSFNVERKDGTSSFSEITAVQLMSRMLRLSGAHWQRAAPPATTRSQAPAATGMH